MATKDSKLTQARLKELLHYNPETGVFTRLVSLNFAVKVGDVAGSLMKKGYWAIGVDKTKHKAHRLAWLYVHGVWPKDQVDHINGVKTDNRIENLREATNAENSQNVRPWKGRKMFGHQRKDNGKWAVAINTGADRRHIGLFDTQEQAHTAYLAAKAKYHTFNPILTMSAS